MTRKKHPKKEVEDAVRYAESKGWRYKKAGGSAHCWGRLYCVEKSREGCSFSVYSTPRSPGNRAKRIRCEVDDCKH